MIVESEEDDFDEYPEDWSSGWRSRWQERNGVCGGILSSQQSSDDAEMREVGRASFGRAGVEEVCMEASPSHGGHLTHVLAMGTFCNVRKIMEALSLAVARGAGRVPSGALCTWCGMTEAELSCALLSHPDIFEWCESGVTLQKTARLQIISKREGEELYPGAAKRMMLCSISSS